MKLSLGKVVGACRGRVGVTRMGLGHRGSCSKLTSVSTSLVLARNETYIYRIGMLASLTFKPEHMRVDEGRRTLRDVAIVCIVAIVAMLPSLVYGPDYSHSASYNLTWTHEVAVAFGRGEIYPRWLDHTFGGLGSSTFYFYPPLSYWLSGRLEQFGLSTETAINLAALILYAASGLTMLLWLRSHGYRWALIGAIVYIVAPYHLTQFYVRGALAELATYAALPLVALAIEAVDRRRWAVPLLAVSYALLILSHLAVALLASLFLIAPMVVARVVKEPRALVGLATGGLTGLALSAIFLGPALTLQPQVSMEMMRTAFLQPSNWSIFIHHPMIRHLAFLQYASLAVAPLLIAGSALYAAVRARDAAGRFWPILTLAAVAMSLGVVPIFWRLPLLELVQFPWRLLVIIEFAAITLLVAAPRRVAVLAVVASLPGLFMMTRNAHQMLASRMAHPDVVAEWQRIVPDADEYLPAGIRSPGVTIGQRKLRIGSLIFPLVQGGRGTLLADGSIAIAVINPGMVVVRRFYFPGFVAVRDGIAQPVTPTSADRLISFAAKPGTYLLRRDLLPIERSSAWVSLAGLLATLALLVQQWRRSSGLKPVEPLVEGVLAAAEGQADRDALEAEFVA